MVFFDQVANVWFFKSTVVIRKQRVPLSSSKPFVLNKIEIVRIMSCHVVAFHIRFYFLFLGMAAKAL